MILTTAHVVTDPAARPANLQTYPMESNVGASKTIEIIDERTTAAMESSTTPTIGIERNSSDAIQDFAGEFGADHHARMSCKRTRPNPARPNAIIQSANAP